MSAWESGDNGVRLVLLHILFYIEKMETEKEPSGILPPNNTQSSGQKAILYPPSGHQHLFVSSWWKNIEKFEQQKKITKKLAKAEKETVNDEKEGEKVNSG